MAATLFPAGTIAVPLRPRSPAVPPACPPQHQQQHSIRVTVIHSLIHWIHFAYYEIVRYLVLSPGLLYAAINPNPVFD